MKKGEETSSVGKPLGHSVTTSHCCQRKKEEKINTVFKSISCQYEVPRDIKGWKVNQNRSRQPNGLISDINIGSCYSDYYQWLLRRILSDFWKMAFLLSIFINIKIQLLISKVDFATPENQIHFYTHSFSDYKTITYFTDVSQTDQSDTEGASTVPLLNGICTIYLSYCSCKELMDVSI